MTGNFTYIVNKAFNGAGHRRVVGEIVDATNWRTLSRLVSMTWLLPFTGTAKTAVKCECGRVFLNDVAKRRHACALRAQRAS